MDRGRRGGFGLILLISHIIRLLDEGGIPPITLGIVGLQTVAFMRMIPIPWKRTGDVCISLANVWYRKQWPRLIFAAFEHADDMHLYYNMASFLWKGRTLERKFGSAKFLYIVVVFTFLSNVTYLGLHYLAAICLDDDYVYSCAVGFSGVVFALKVLTTHYWPYNHYSFLTFGDIPSKYVVWLELALIQLIAPNASFIGHLAGILVGLAYVSGPLKSVMDIFSGDFGSIFPSRRFRFSRRLDENHGSSGTATAPPHLYSFVPEDLTEEEQIRLATEESLRDAYSSPRQPRQFGSDTTNYSTRRNNLYPDLEEIRNLRANRFS